MKKRAFVKYTKKGQVIPGSLIVTTKGGYPKDGLYKEVSTNLCCPDPAAAVKLTFTGDTVFACPARTLTLTLENLPAVYDSIVWTIYSEDGPTITSGQGTAELVVSVPAVTGFAFTASVIVYDADGNVLGAGSSIGAVVDCP